MAIYPQECLRCGHKWIPRRIDEMPVQCPKCRSPFWNRERIEKQTTKPEGGK